MKKKRFISLLFVFAMCLTITVYAQETDGSSMFCFGVQQAVQAVQDNEQAEYTDTYTVKFVQQVLNELGYDCGNADGYIGANTTQAISDYQTDNDLVVTGSINQSLLTALGIKEEDGKLYLEDPAADAIEGEVWLTPLPDGLTASVELFDDFTILVHYKNHTGEDISLTTYYAFGDENEEMFQQGATSTSYLKDGSEYIAILDAWDPIVYFGLDYEIGRVLQRTREANEALSVDSHQNSDGSVTATFTTTQNGTSVGGYIFYLDKYRKVISYENFGIGFGGSMSYPFSAPEKEYFDYIICYEALA